MNINSLTIFRGGISLEASSLLRLVCLPELQLPMLNSIGSLPKYGEQTNRTVSINPYNGKDYRDEERELQRKRCHHGLKVEWVDFSTTVMERARSRLRESAMQRKRSTTERTETRNNPRKIVTAADAAHFSQL